VRPVLLDVTRLVSRVGGGPATGIDRVEAAYLNAIVNADCDAFGLCRLASGLAVLDRGGLAALGDRLTGAVPWGPSDVAAGLSRRITPARRRAEADVRRLAVAHQSRFARGAGWTSALPRGLTAFNVGHSNLDPRTLAPLAALEGTRLAVMIHDTIPLDFPGFQPAGAPARFADRLACVSAHADTVIAISDHTAARCRDHFGRIGRVPAITVAPLGVTRPVPGDLPDRLCSDRPVFVALGTIEPRKNHALLLDIWEGFAADPSIAATAPALVIAGRRGWADPALLSRLDAATATGLVREENDLDDPTLAALLQASAGLLFPSHAEGFGLPPAEAAAMGVPVLSAPLPTVRETLGNIPVYADPADRYLWATTIMRLAKADRAQPRARTGAEGLPTWQDHFNKVFTHLC